MNWFRKFIQKFGCGHDYIFVRNIYGDEINQCGGYRSLWQCMKCGKYTYSKTLYSQVNKNLKETLDKFYDEYYENEYKDWVKEHEEFLHHITNKLIDAASNGKCYFEFVMTCKTSTDDRWHFKQWLEENKLEYEYELYHQLEEYDEINQYMFKIRWK